MKIWRKVFFVIIAFFSLGLSPVYAQYGEEYGANLELGNTGPLDLAINIINWALGILALVAVVIILYGGFIWLTSGGNEEKLEQAKKILRNGLIGLVIILSAWGITYFILSTLADITGAPTEDRDPAPPGDDLGGVGSFYVTGTDPYDTEGSEEGSAGVSLCHIIQVFFNYELLASTTSGDYSNISENFCVYPANSDCETGGLSGAFALPTSGRGFVFYPSEDYQASTTYQVDLSSYIQGIDDDLLLEYLTGGYSFTFTTGTETDTIPPYVDFTYAAPYPTDNGEDICRNTILQATFSESIDSASVNDDNIWLYNYTESEDGSRPSPLDELTVDSIGLTTIGSGEDSERYNTVYAYPETELTAFTEYGLSLYSGDADGVGAIMDTCGNPLDGDYDGLAEGSTTDDFIEPLSTDPDSITDQQDRETGTWLYPWIFTTGENTDCVPVISGINPISGYYSEDNGDDTFSDKIEISGYYLMNAYDVEFYDGVSAGDYALSCFDTDHKVTEGCIESKSDNSIIVRTPVSSQTGTISAISESGTGTSTSTYTVNSPYIRWLSPSSGPVGQSVTIKGLNFGDYVPTDGGLTSRGTVYFRDFVNEVDYVADFPCTDGWDDTQIIVTVPEGVELSDPTDGVNVQVVLPDGTHYSNYITFTYEEGTPGPTLCTIEPSCSETGAESIYLGGVGFSAGQGASYFYNYDLDSSAEATISAWDAGTDASTATLSGAPLEYQNTLGDFNVVVQNDDEDSSESNGLDFSMPCTDAPNVVQTSSCNPDEDAFPLPNPYLNEDEACRNSAVLVGFDQTMDDTTFTRSNIAIYKCNDGYNDDSEDISYNSADCDTSVNLLTPRLIDRDYTTSGGYDGFKIEGFRFKAEYWYQIVLGTGILSEVTTSDEGVTTGGVGLSSDYSWHFRIRDLDENCQADYLNLSPSYRNFNSFDQTSFDSSDDYTSWQDFTASPYTVECIALSSESTTWTLIDSTDPEDGLTETAQEVVSFNNATAPTTLVTTETTSNGDNNIYMMGDADTTATIAGNEGNVYLRAVVDGGAYDNAPVSVDFGYCENTAACEDNCPGSVCDLTTYRCTPVISNVSPVNGGADSCITISGCYFGNDQGDGDVYLGSSDNLFTYPANPNCDNWDDDQIIAKVPNIAEDSYTLTVLSAYGLTDSYINPFTVNTEERPCLCSIDPYGNREGGAEILYGEDFGLYGGSSAVSFYSTPSRESADISLDESDLPDWQDDEINTSVPQGAATGLASEGNEGVYMVDSGGTASNPLNFSVTCERDSDCGTGCCSEGACSDPSVCNACYDQEDCTDVYAGCYGDCVDSVCEPYIASISPDSGDTGQPVTISGCYFGSSGTVYFDEDEADPICRDSSWSNIQALVKTPDSENWGTDDIANVSLINNSSLTSNSVEFELNNSCTGYAYPILCDLFNDDTNNPYGPYEGPLWFEGENFTDLEEQYCLCTNTDLDETCSVAIGNDTCSGENTCRLTEPCNENREGYDSLTGTCPCYNDAEEEVCSVPEIDEVADEDGWDCDYEFFCELLSSCETDSETYQSVSGYIDYPGSGLFSDEDYAAAYLGRGPTALSTYVPAYDSGATSGDVYVGTQDTETSQSCDSNGLNFDIICSNCSDVPEGQNCDLSYGGEEGYGRVTDSNIGYCQDYPDSCCGSTGCAIDEDTEIGTCTERPTIVSTTPSDEATDVCLNATVSVTFSEEMEGIIGNVNNPSEYINLFSGSISSEDDLGATVTTSDNKTFTITLPGGTALTGNTTYYIEVTSNSSDESGIVSTETGLAVDQTSPYYVNFTTADTVDACPIDLVEIEATSSDFEDAGYTLTAEGETQGLRAVAYSSDGQALTSIENYYSWVWSWSPDYADCDIAGVYTSGESYDANSNYQTIIAGAVEGNISATATATADYGWSGSESGIQNINVLFCDSDYLWSYENSDYNISMIYCRSEDGDADTALPALGEEPAIIEIGSDAMAEFLFTFEEESGNEDALGLRIYANNLQSYEDTTFIDAVTPALWYQTFFETTDSVSETTVDGYAAAQVGRSTYIAATNESSSGTLYPNIYLLSYSQDAETDTEDVVNLILANLQLSTNVDSACGSDDSDKQKLIRDTERLTEIGTLAYYLDQYYNDNSSFPALATGSYVQQWSTSKWPSWQATLGNDLGYALPEDPYNVFYTTGDDPCGEDPYESETCWDDTNKVFSGPGQSSFPHYYMYKGTSDGSFYNLYANFEYTDGDWDSTVTDPCSNPSSCDSFNYDLEASTYGSAIYGTFSET